MDNFLVGDYSGYNVYIEDDYMGKGGKLCIIERAVIFYINSMPRLIPFGMVQNYSKLEDGFTVTSICEDGISRKITVQK